MSTRSNIRPRPVDVNKQLVIYKDATELELDADMQAAEMVSQVRTYRCCLHDTKLSSQQHPCLSLTHGVPHTVAGPHSDPRHPSQLTSRALSGCSCDAGPRAWWRPRARWRAWQQQRQEAQGHPHS